MKFEGTKVNIPIKGIMRAGTDNLAPDGAMNEVIGMEYKDGSYLPYKETLSEETVDLADHLVVKTYVHKIDDDSTVTLYLTEETGTGTTTYKALYLPKVVSGVLTLDTPIVTHVRDVAFVGNMVCVATDDGIKYFIYQEGDYSEWQTGYYPRVDLRVTAGLYDAEDEEDESDAPSSENDEIGIASMSRFLGEKLDYTDRSNCLISDETLKMSVISAMTSAIGEARDRGGLTGYIVACPAYRLRNGSVVAAGAPVLLGRPLKRAEDNEWNLNESWGTFGGNAVSHSNPEYYIRDRYDNMLTLSSIDRAESSLPDEGFSVIRKAHNDYYDYDYCKTHDEGSSQQTQYHYGVILKCSNMLNSNYDIPAIENGTSLYSTYKDNPYKDTDTQFYRPNVPNMSCAVYRSYYWEGDEVTGKVRMDYFFQGMAASNKLQFRVPSLSLAENRDIMSLCIFISQEVSPYMLERDISDFDEIVYSGKRYYNQLYIYLHSLPEVSKTLDSQSFHAIHRLNSSIIGDIKNIGSLYLVKEVNVEDITPSDNWIDVDLKGLLGATLATRESLPITSFDRNYYYPNHLDTYNLRLHMYDYSCKLFEGYPMAELGHYGGEYQYDSEYFSNGILQSKYKWEIIVNIKDRSGNSYVVNYDNSAVNYLIKSLSPVISYPSNDAYSITIRVYEYVDRQGVRAYEKTLNLSHDWALGLAYYIDPDLKPIAASLIIDSE